MALHLKVHKTQTSECDGHTLSGVRLKEVTEPHTGLWCCLTEIGFIFRFFFFHRLLLIHRNRDHKSHRVWCPPIWSHAKLSFHILTKLMTKEQTDCRHYFFNNRIICRLFQTKTQLNQLIKFKSKWNNNKRNLNYDLIGGLEIVLIRKFNQSDMLFLLWC